MSRNAVRGGEERSDGGRGPNRNMLLLLNVSALFVGFWVLFRGCARRRVGPEGGDPTLTGGRVRVDVLGQVPLRQGRLVVVHGGA
jgi:hypothetical protein